MYECAPIVIAPGNCGFLLQDAIGLNKRFFVAARPQVIVSNPYMFIDTLLSKRFDCLMKGGFFFFFLEETDSILKSPALIVSGINLKNIIDFYQSFGIASRAEELFGVAEMLGDFFEVWIHDFYSAQA